MLFILHTFVLSLQKILVDNIVALLSHVKYSSCLFVSFRGKFVTSRARKLLVRVEKQVMTGKRGKT